MKISFAKISDSPVTYYLRIEGELPKSLNSSLGRNPWTARNHAKTWKQKSALGAAAFRREKPLERVTIRALRHGTRYLDADNFAASLKSTIDGLKGLIIKDDSWEVTGAWQLEQVKRPRKLGSMLEIWITDAEGSPAESSSSEEESASCTELPSA